MSEIAHLSPIKHIALTTTQRDGLGAVGVGTEIWNSSLGVQQYYDGSAWQTVVSQNAGDARYLQQASALSELTSVAATARTNIGAAAQGLAQTRWAELFFMTHSYGSGGPTGASDAEFTFIRRFAGDLGINKVSIYAKGGLAGFNPDTGDIATSVGVGGLFRYSYPNHVYGTPTNNGPAQSAKQRGAIDIFCIGHNDGVYYISDSTNLSRAYLNSMRAVLAWRRNGRYYNILHSALAFNGAGWGSTQTNLNNMPGNVYKQTSGLNDYVEFTIPATYTGGDICLYLLGNPNGFTNLTQAITTAPAVGTSEAWSVADRSSTFPAASFVIKIDNEQMLVTATGSGAGNFTMTRGYNGSTPATHLNGSEVRRPAANTTYLDFSSSTANLAGNGAGVAPVSVRGFDASGRFFIGGQGFGGYSVFQVCRFTGLTAADAGLKIRATLKNLGSQTGSIPGEVFRPFAVGIHDTEGHVQVLINGATFAFALSSVNSAINGFINTLVGEYSDAYVANVALEFSALYGGVWQTATSTGTTLHMTPDNYARNVLSKGSVLRTDSEEMLVTSAITKTSNTDWSFTVTRNYTGDDSGTGGAASSGNVNHALGAGVYICEAMRSDRIHPADVGHDLHTRVLGAAVGAISQSASQIASSGATQILDEDQGWANGGYLSVPSSLGNRGTKAPTSTKEWAYPVKLPAEMNILALAVLVTTLANPSGVRFGIYTDGYGCPGYLIYDTGASYALNALVSTTATGLAVATLTPLLPRLRERLWVSVVAQTGNPTLQATSTGGQSQLDYRIPLNAANILTNKEVIGCSRSSVTGALTDWDMAAQFAESGNYAYELTSIAVPQIYLQLERFRSG